MQHEARRFAEDGSTAAHMLEGTVSEVRELAALGRLGAAHAVVLANSGSLSCCALNRCETDPCCDSDRPCCVQMLCFDMTEAPFTPMAI